MQPNKIYDIFSKTLMYCDLEIPPEVSRLTSKP